MIVFVAGIETATSNEVWIFRNGLFLVSLLLSLQAACNAVAFILHYFFLSAFCWMLCEGIHDNYVNLSGFHAKFFTDLKTI